MFGIGLWYRWRARHEQIVVSRKTALKYAVLALAFVDMLLIPLTYVLTFAPALRRLSGAYLGGVDWYRHVSFCAVAALADAS